MRNACLPVRILLLAASCLVAAAGGNAQSREPLPTTALRMTLVGVMADSAEPARSACLILCAEPAGRKHASLVQAGETVCDLAEVREIRRDSVIVRNLSANRLELLPLPESGAPTNVRPAAAESHPAPVAVNEAPGLVSVDVPKASVEHYLVNLSEVLSAAQTTPRYRDSPNGQRVIEGFELRQIKTGSVVEQVGLREGDVFLEVNGEALDGLPAVLRLFGQAQTMGQARLTVLRGGQRMTFVFNTK